MPDASWWRQFEDHWVERTYHVGGLLGAGGFGAVFAAEHIVEGRLLRRVAIKFLPSGNDPRQLDELIAGANLRDVHLIQCFHAGSLELRGSRFLYLVMELAAESLQQRMQQGRLNLRDTLEVAVQMGHALEYIQSQGVAHRDVKPANIMRVGELWKLADFGTVRVQVDETKQITGTLNYMCPESFNGVVSVAGDVWALGATLLEAAAGARPYAASSEGALMRAIMQDAPSIPMELDQALDAIVRGCLERDTRKRLTAQGVGQMAMAALTRLNAQGAAVPSRRSLTPERDCAIFDKDIQRGFYELPCECRPGWPYVRFRKHAELPVVRECLVGWKGAHPCPGDFDVGLMLGANDSLVVAQKGWRRLALSTFAEWIAFQQETTGDVEIWSLPQIERKRRFQLPGPVSQAGFGPGGQLACVCDREDGIWYLSADGQLRKLREGESRFSHLTFSGSGRFLAAADEGLRIHLWNLEAETKLATSPPQDRVDGLSLSLDGAWLAAGAGNSVRIWFTQGGLLRTLDAGERVIWPRFSPRAEQLAIVCRSGVQLWDVAGNLRLASFPFAVTEGAFQLAFRGDGRTLAFGNASYASGGPWVMNPFRFCTAGDTPETCQCETLPLGSPKLDQAQLEALLSLRGRMNSNE